MASVGNKKTYPGQQTLVASMHPLSQGFSPAPQVPVWRPSRPDRLGDVAMLGEGRVTALSATARAKISEASMLVDFVAFGESD